MPATARMSSPGTDEHEGLDSGFNPEFNSGLQHRIRHITSLQVRNLTPFPVRDEVASALIQPAEQSQFTAQGHLSDDLDLSLNRKRGRRRSATSLSTISWQQPPKHDFQGAESSGRERATSRASIATTTGSGVTYSGTSSASKARSTHAAPALSRPPLRQRTHSTASSVSVGTLRSHDTAVQPPLSLSGFLQDTSQDALEHILQSRLVETFLTLRAVPSEAGSPQVTPQSSGHRNSAVNGHEDIKTRRRSTTTSFGSGSMSRASTFTKTITSPHSTGPRAGPSSHSKSSSLSASLNGKNHTTPSATKPLSQRAPIPKALTTPKTPSTPFSAPSNSDRLIERPIPDYISPISRPSTNPRFEIDPQGGFEFGPDANLGATKVEVEIWGRLSHDIYGKGKGKERAHSLPIPGTEEWQILKHWEVDLNKLSPLTDDLAQRSSHLPSNTLCITLEPLGRTYYVPTSQPTTTLFRRSRSLSPPPGYSSEPELDASDIDTRPSLKTKHPPESATEHSLGNSLHPDQDADPEHRNSRWKRTRTSASWQSIVKLVTLQAVIQDTERSVAQLGKEISPYLIGRSTVALNREVSEREAWVNDLRSQRALIRERADDLRRRVQEKREELESRRKMLSAAYEAHSEDIREEAEQKIHVEEARTDLMLLRSQLAPIRNELLTSLAFIFPIELLSPPDLLFTILDVPLPIPTGPTDPAPPLSLPSRKDVSEDSVATALGYAAQLVQLLAAYLGQRLVYPVTCVGSKSVIKDGISAMVGPRMFPLFSKGVDTYRFEYGVFLLNKNIELLMSEHDLRALDMRHTLPNLKNLLLTLTNPDTVAPRTHHRSSSIASTTISALQSPMLTPAATEDPESLDGKTPDSVDVSSLEGPRIEVDSPPASGSTTPTVPTPTSTVRKSRAFLDLTPLSGFWRSRNTSSSSSRESGKAEPPLEDDHAGEATPTISSTTVNVVQPAQEESVSGSSDDEDDRRTIQAPVSGGESGDETHVPKRRGRSKAGPKNMVNGNVNGVGAGHEVEVKKEEKVAGQLSMEPHVVDGVS